MESTWSKQETDLFDLSIDEVIANSVKRWEENRKSKNQTIGEDRAQQELAFRDAIVSEKQEKLGKSEKYFWITVNPRKSTELPAIIKSVQSMYKKKWIEKYAYVYETTENSHMHSHGLIKATYEAARARKELANSVKTICDITNTHCFKFVILDEKAAIEKMHYMLGKKKQKKMKDVELTVEWRKAQNLNPIYNSDEPPILLVRQETSPIAENTPEWEFDL